MQKIWITVRRMTKGNTQSVISLLPRNRAHLRFGNRKTLSEYRDELLNNGILIQHRAPLYGQNDKKRNAGYIGCENLTFVVRITLKKPDLYSKFYLPDVVNSIKNSVCSNEQSIRLVYMAGSNKPLTL